MSGSFGKADAEKDRLSCMYFMHLRHEGFFCLERKPRINMSEMSAYAASRPSIRPIYLFDGIRTAKITDNICPIGPVAITIQKTSPLLFE